MYIETLTMSILDKNRGKAFLTLLFVCTISILAAQKWQNNFNTALQMAADDNKALILVFAGSDWCAPCIKLEKEIWESDDFKTYAKEHFVLYKADFPRKKSNKLSKELEEQNKQLAEKYNSRGYFPLVIVLNEDGKVVGETGYKKVSPKDYIEHLNSFLNQ